MKVCVFCSANANIAPEYFTAADDLARWAAHEGHAIVYGGCDLGLMERVAATAKASGATTIGVVPTIIERGGHASQHTDVTIPCDNLTDRKALMMAQSDVFVALPGGIGTLDEIFTVAASATIGYHHKPIYLLNVDHFWDALIALLDDMQQRGMIRGSWTSIIRVVDRPEEILV